MLTTVGREKKFVRGKNSALIPSSLLTEKRLLAELGQQELGSARDASCRA